MKQVIVHWRDTSANAHSLSFGEIEEEATFETSTMGYLTNEDDRFVTLVQTIFSKSGDLIIGKHTFCIPRISILYIEEVVKKKIVYRHP